MVCSTTRGDNGALGVGPVPGRDGRREDTTPRNLMFSSSSDSARTCLEAQVGIVWPICSAASMLGFIAVIGSRAKDPRDAEGSLGEYS